MPYSTRTDRFVAVRNELAARVKGAGYDNLAIRVIYEAIADGRLTGQRPRTRSAEGSAVTTRSPRQSS